MSRAALKKIAQSSDVGASLLTKLASEVGHDQIVETIKDLLAAKVFDRNANKMMPDFKAREAGAKMYLSYMVGMPIQRTVTVEKKEESEGETMTRLLESPAARQAMKRALKDDDGEVLEA